MLSSMGLDDPDNLGYLIFGGSSGSHPQTKLSECDPNITSSLAIETVLASGK